MSEHYTRNTLGVTKWCNRCGRLTMHSVSGGRIGRCEEHGGMAPSQKQIRDRERRAREQVSPRFDFGKVA